jgi:hypothetical protein
LHASPHDGETAGDSHGNNVDQDDGEQELGADRPFVPKPMQYAPAERRR